MILIVFLMSLQAQTFTTTDLYNYSVKEFKEVCNDSSVPTKQAFVMTCLPAIDFETLICKSILKKDTRSLISDAVRTKYPKWDSINYSYTTTDDVLSFLCSNNNSPLNACCYREIYANDGSTIATLTKGE
jgi:hypothetical protein